MGENTWGQPQPLWQFKNDGKEIQQLLNSAPGIAIGNAKLAGVDFEGTFYVGPHDYPDNDFIGIIFSFQVNLIPFLPLNCILLYSRAQILLMQVTY